MEKTGREGALRSGSQQARPAMGTGLRDSLSKPRGGSTCAGTRKASDKVERLVTPPATHFQTKD